jgi:hypothetical protein
VFPYILYRYKTCFWEAFTMKMNCNRYSFCKTYFIGLVYFFNTVKLMSNFFPEYFCDSKRKGPTSSLYVWSQLVSQKSEKNIQWGVRLAPSLAVQKERGIPIKENRSYNVQKPGIKGRLKPLLWIRNIFITDPDPTFQWVPDPDLTFKKLRIQFRIRSFSSRNMILKVLKWHFKTYFSKNTGT